MLDFVRSYLDELLTSLFLLLVAVLTVVHPPHFATPGGLLLARIVLWSAAVLVCVLLVVSRFSLLGREALRFVLDFGLIVVAVIGYVSLRLFNAFAISAWLGIPSFDHAMMAADVAIFGKTPYLWFVHWGLDGGLFARVMSGFYALYPFTPLLAVGWFLWQGDRKQFHLVRRALIISLYSGYVCYLLIPVSGPLTLAATTAPTFPRVDAHLFIPGVELPLPIRLFSQLAHGQSVADCVAEPGQGAGVADGSGRDRGLRHYAFRRCARGALRNRRSRRTGVGFPDCGGGQGFAARRAVGVTAAGGARVPCFWHVFSTTKVVPRHFLWPVKSFSAASGDRWYSTLSL